LGWLTVSLAVCLRPSTPLSRRLPHPTHCLHTATLLSAPAACQPLQLRQGFTFWLAIANNIFAICGLAGVLNQQRELVIAFFAFNATQMVALFHFFIDLVADARK
jgi:hypothetical protein